MVTGKALMPSTVALCVFANMKKNYYIDVLRIRKSTPITTGAPKTGVMTLMGIMESEGRVEIRLHNNVRQAPVRSVAGKRVR